jgi:hypothetical protein
MQITDILARLLHAKIESGCNHSIQEKAKPTEK